MTKIKNLSKEEVEIVMHSLDIIDFAQRKPGRWAVLREIIDGERK
jgi:hypothetical protein